MNPKTTISTTMGALDWTLLIGLAILWGGSYFFGKFALGEVGPLTLVLARFAPAAVTLYIACRVTGHRLPTDAKAWLGFLGMALLNNSVPYSLITWSQTHIGAGLASIINAASPIFTVILAHFLTRDERLTANRFLGVLLGFAGVAVLMGPGAFQSLGVDSLALLAPLAAAVLYAFAGIYGRRFQGTPPLITTTGIVIVTTILAIPPSLLVEHPWTLRPSPATWGALAMLAFVSTALGYVIFYRVLASAGATNILLVTLLMPVSALILSMMFLDEHPAPSSFAGMALIVLGLVAIDGRLLVALRLMPKRATATAGR